MTSPRARALNLEPIEDRLTPSAGPHGPDWPGCESVRAGPPRPAPDDGPEAAAPTPVEPAPPAGGPGGATPPAPDVGPTPTTPAERPAARRPGRDGPAARPGSFAGPDGALPPDAVAFVSVTLPDAPAPAAEVQADDSGSGPILRRPPAPDPMVGGAVPTATPPAPTDDGLPEVTGPPDGPAAVAPAPRDPPDGGDLPGGEPLLGRWGIDVRDVEAAARAVVEWLPAAVEWAADPERLLWLTAGAVAVVGTGYAVRARRRTAADPVLLGIDGVLLVPEDGCDGANRE